MIWLRRGLWLLAALPIAAALAYPIWAAGMPEPVLVRASLGAAAAQWSFDSWLEFGREPLHAAPRALLLGALHVPGATLQWAAAVTAVLAVLLAWSLSRLVVRTAGVASAGAALALGGAAVLCCSPAFGADWLSAERCGIVLPPLLLVSALLVLQGERWCFGRCLAAALLAAAAPFCHDLGVLVPVALLPAVAEAARRGGHRPLPWIGAAFAIGATAAVYSLWAAGTHRAGGPGLLAMFAAGPDGVLGVLAAIGGTWLDPLPGTWLDQWLLGAATVVLLAVLPFRAPPADPRTSAPWWSCACFGLLAVLWNAERHGAPAVWLQRELGYGAFLLPIGCVGLLAARCGTQVWAMGLGALAILGLQDWQRGVEALRAAHAEALRVEAALGLPAGDESIGSLATTRSAEEFAALVERGWVRRPAPDAFASAATVAMQPVDPAFGAVLDAGPTAMRGTVRSSLRWPSASAVLVAGASADGQTWTLLAAALPQFAGRGRDVVWDVSWPAAPAEGTRLQAFGLLAREGRLVRLGGGYVVKDGAVVPAAGP